MAYEFQPDNATTDVSQQDVTLSRKKYEYNFSIYYCVFLTENQLDEPVQFSIHLNQVSESSSARNVTELYIRSEKNECYNEPCYDVRDCLIIAAASARCGRYNDMTRADCEYHFMMDAGGFR